MVERKKKEDPEWKDVVGGVVSRETLAVFLQVRILSFFFSFLAFVLGGGGLGSGMLMIFWEWWKKIAERGGGDQYGRRDVRRVHGQGLGTALLDELGRYPSVRRRR